MQHHIKVHRHDENTTIVDNGYDNFSMLLEELEEVLAEHVFQFLDFRTIQWLEQCARTFHELICKYDRTIYSKLLCNTLFNGNLKFLPMGNDHPPTQQLIMTILHDELCKTISDENIHHHERPFRNLFKEWMLTPFSYSNGSNVCLSYETFLLMGGSVDISFLQPCRFLSVVFEKCYHELDPECQFLIHKFMIMCHVLPLFWKCPVDHNRWIDVSFSKELVPFKSVIPSSFSMNFIDRLYNWIGELFTASTTATTATTDETISRTESSLKIQRKIQILPGELFIHMCGDFQAMKQAHGIPKEYRTILQPIRNYYTSEEMTIDYNSINEGNQILYPTSEYLDIFTRSSGSVYGTKPALPTTFAPLRKESLDIDSEHPTYDHLIQYDFTAMIENNELWNNYWRYAQEFITYTVYNTKRNHFVVLSSNPQD